MNVLEENHLPSDEREVHLKRIEFIGDGQAGVGHSKVIQRSIERCAMAVWN